jgi:hypothetical protein
MPRTPTNRLPWHSRTSVCLAVQYGPARKSFEAGTYLYMSARYELPTGIAWALVIARAVAAPLLSVYLSMARPRMPGACPCHWGMRHKIARRVRHVAAKDRRGGGELG